MYATRSAVITAGAAALLVAATLAGPAVTHGGALDAARASGSVVLPAARERGFLGERADTRDPGRADPGRADPGRADPGRRDAGPTTFASSAPGPEADGDTTDPRCGDDNTATVFGDDNTATVFGDDNTAEAGPGARVNSTITGDDNTATPSDGCITTATGDGQAVYCP